MSVSRAPGGRGWRWLESSFIVPAALITAAVAWTYVRYGTLPLAESLLAGVKPAVIAVIVDRGMAIGKDCGPRCVARHCWEL